MVMKPFEEMLHDKSFYKNIILTFIDEKKIDNGTHTYLVTTK